MILHPYEYMSHVKRFDLKLPIFIKPSEGYKRKARAFTSPGFIDIHTHKLQTILIILNIPIRSFLDFTLQR